MGTFKHAYRRARRQAQARRPFVICAAAVSLFLFLAPTHPLSASAADSEAAPTSVNGMLVRDAWLQFHPADAGPALILQSQAGSGPTELEVISGQYPEALAYISPDVQKGLAQVRVGSVSSVSLVFAHAPASAVSLTDAGGGCGDPNDCDYYMISFTNTSTFNGYNTSTSERVDGYRDDGSTVAWTWHWQNFNGQDGPTGQYHNWNGSMGHAGNYSQSLGGSVMDYYSFGWGFGSWTVVQLGFSWPPFSVAVYENMYADLCINEKTTWPGGASGSATEHISGATSAYDAGDNVTSGTGYSPFSSCG